LNGSDCMVCNDLDPLCDNGRCQCDANNCPNGCCSNGPGNPGQCFIDDPRFCGTNGVACAACPDGLACNGQQQCVCTAESCLPSTGRTCQGNQCLCDSSICDGCCGDGLCKPGTVVEACGKVGTECGVCSDAGWVCVDQACCPGGTLGACANFGNCCPPGERCCAPNQGENDFCCPSDQACAGDRCCAPGTTHVCNSSYVGWECCDPGVTSCCDDGNGGETCC
jgi:hypothetical protein